MWNMTKPRSSLLTILHDNVDDILEELIRTLAHERGHLVAPIYTDDAEKEEAKARAIGDAAVWAYKKALEIDPQDTETKLKLNKLLVESGHATS